MAYRLALSLAVLRHEINTRWPGRDTASDGWIGDAAHATRTSDHNPWVKDPAGVGVVRALDTDAGTGGDTSIGLALAEHLRWLGNHGHPALREGSYVISNRRIASPVSGWTWRTYTGANPHITHTHLSVSLAHTGYDATTPWGILGPAPAPPGPAPAPSPVPGARPTLRPGSTGAAVAELQRILNAWYPNLPMLKPDGQYGPRTRDRVRYLQERAGLAVDGITGPRTWAVLLGR